ncbi:hypothetical protein E2C01_067595 [Portunus trituberculatus]|uniref:Uncharacterized protein n=1 Tax=Portunus trituberculatus TaxID=210409 RepID=A0A5B7HPR3_PORTR|nr:hypothetical protein [Portunus trituberculatus]
MLSLMFSFSSVRISCACLGKSAYLRARQDTRHQTRHSSKDVMVRESRPFHTGDERTRHTKVGLTLVAMYVHTGRDARRDIRSGGG